MQQLEAGMQYRLESLMEFELKSKDKKFRTTMKIGEGCSRWEKLKK